MLLPAVTQVNRITPYRFKPRSNRADHNTLRAKTISTNNLILPSPERAIMMAGQQ